MLSKIFPKFFARREAIKALREFGEDYFLQDNCCTAYPIYFQIREVDFVASYQFDESDRYIFVGEEGIEYGGSDLPELFTNIKAGVPEHFPTDIIIDDSLCIVDCEELCGDLSGKLGYNCYIYGEKKSEKFIGMFLLSSEARDHLKANYYKYSDEATVYCQHAYRAPKTKRLMELMKDL